MEGNSGDAREKVWVLEVELKGEAGVPAHVVVAEKAKSLREREAEELADLARAVLERSHQKVLGDMAALFLAASLQETARLHSVLVLLHDKRGKQGESTAMLQAHIHIHTHTHTNTNTNTHRPLLQVLRALGESRLRLRMCAGLRGRSLWTFPAAQALTASACAIDCPRPRCLQV
jgi:hypothetical protein